MKKSRYTPEQVAFGLRQAEEGTPVAKVCRKMGIRTHGYYGDLNDYYPSGSWQYSTLQPAMLDGRQCRAA